MTTATKVSIAELERVLFGDGHPCGGVPHIGITACGEKATWHTKGHGCGPAPSDYKCDRCYKAWRRRIQDTLASWGWVNCRACNRIFRDIDEFSPYRRLA